MTIADDKEEYVEVEVIKQKTRFQKHVFFIYDCSGSMGRSELNRAFTAFAMIAEQPIDEMEIALLAFDDITKRWPGIPEPDSPNPVPKGWAAMPSATAFKKAHNWLDNLDLKGGTSIAPALKEALKENRNNISIVIISDGGFSDDIPSSFPRGDSESFVSYGTKYYQSLITTLQSERVKAKLDHVQINCFGVGAIIPNSKEDKFMTTIATVGGGFYVREKIKDKKATDEIPDIQDPGQ